MGVIEMKRFLSFILFLFIILSSNIVVFAEETGWPTDPTKQTQAVTSQEPIVQQKESSNVIHNGSLKPIQVSDINSTLIPIDQEVSGTKSTTINSNQRIYNGSSESKRIASAYTNDIPEVSIDDAIDWANRKGFEVIHFLQAVVQPFAIIIFIISSFITLIGSIGRGDLASKGMYGLVISAVMYALVLYAPVILQTFVGWVSS